MSRLDKLIKEKCPNGVKFIELGKVCEITKGRGLSKSDKSTGDIPIILYGELYTTYGNYIDRIVSSASEIAKRSLLIAKNDLLLPVSSTTKEAQIGKASVYRVEDECYLGGDAIRLRHEQNPGFLMYVINSTYFEKQKMKCVSGTTINHLSPIKLSKIKIPIPPIEIQNEIVQILDNFAELTAELTAELSNRKKQYEYYRDLLLNFDKNGERERIRWLRLGDIATILRGGSLQKKDFVESGVPCIHYGQIYTRYGMKANKTLTFINKETALKQRFAETNDIVMAVTSENLEDVCKCVVWLGSEKAAVSGHTAIIKHEQDARYLAYYFGTSMFFAQKRKYAHGTKVIEVSPAKLADIVIPTPPIEVQREIADKLDRFSDLSSDISEGLPAEIEARKKQYEYYRDKLLTFKEAK